MSWRHELEELSKRVRRPGGGERDPVAIPIWRISLLLVLFACRITPDEIQKIESENQLLRQEIRTIKQKCGYYKELELEVEEPPEPGSPEP